MTKDTSKYTRIYLNFSRNIYMISFFKYCVIFGHFLPHKICHLSLFFQLARLFTKLALFKLRFLSPFSMYTTGTKLSFSKVNTEVFILILQCATQSYSKLGNVALKIEKPKFPYLLILEHLKSHFIKP